MLRAYRGARRRLLVLGYNATLTTAVEAPRQPKRHFDQIKARPPCPCMLVHSCLVRRMCSAPSYWVSLVFHCHCRCQAGAWCQMSSAAELWGSRLTATSSAPVTAVVRVHAGRA